MAIPKIPAGAGTEPNNGTAIPKRVDGASAEPNNGTTIPKVVTGAGTELNNGTAIPKIVTGAGTEPNNGTAIPKIAASAGTEGNNGTTIPKRADGVRAEPNNGTAIPKMPASAETERNNGMAVPKVAAATLRLRTTRGLVRARLWSDEAPRTVANLIALVRRRFYDGLSFHRVVPDFVSQGGDPRGDGSGGPGYAIACEIGMRRYRAGVLGMALAGRDTGGSQFFFTHAPQPHLDGRYTAFGEIIEGFDVVMQLIEGDLILEARIE
jgi:cyclophilin family peptidyl-prolyl cis-trans isomerase